MVQAIVNLGENKDRLLIIVKGKFGLKNKSEAVNFVINRYGEELLEPELRPEYVEKSSWVKRQAGLVNYEVIRPGSHRLPIQSAKRYQGKGLQKDHLNQRKPAQIL